jgi:hypothetical protein
MKSSFIAYIDESGCDGFRHDKGSTHWLVLAAAVFRAENELSGVRVVDAVRHELNKDPKKDLHFDHLTHDQRVVYASRVASTSLRGIAVAIHKPSLTDKGTFQVKGRLYNYAVRYLVERISWLCTTARNRDDVGDGKVDLVFSHRRTTSYEDIRDYLDTMRQRGTDIEWSAIDPVRVRAVPHRQLKGLWIADCIAGCIYKGLEINRHGFTEPRYAEILRPIMWSRNRAYSGTGIKLYPKEVLSTLDLDGQHAWLARTYGIQSK